MEPGPGPNQRDQAVRRKYPSDFMPEGVMKLLSRIRGMALILGVCLGLAAVPAQASGPLRIAYPEFPPFHWRDGQGRMQGFFHEIVVEAVERRLGVPTVWTPAPWARCQANVKNGVADAMLTVPTAERAAYALAGREPFYVKHLKVFTYSGHPRMAEITSLRGLEDMGKANLSVVTYSENGWSKAHVEPLGISVQTSNSLHSVWRMLAGRRGDLVIEWPPAAWPDIQALGLADDIVETDVVVGGMPFHLLIGKQSEHIGLLDGFDETIRAMRKDGTLARILDQVEQRGPIHTIRSVVP